MATNLRKENILDTTKEEDEGVDLALSLSIGGSHRKAETTSRIYQLESDSVTRAGESASDLAEKDLPNYPQQRCETWSFEDQMLLEGRRLHSRVKDRVAKENEACWGRGRKVPNRNPNPNPNPSPNPNFAAYGVHTFPVMPMQYSTYHPVPYVSFVNGFGFPYVMPCWAPMVSSVANVLNYPEAIGVKPTPSVVSDSNGSTSSSEISEDDSGSIFQGGRSSDMGSHSSQWQASSQGKSDLSIQSHDQKEESYSQIMEEGSDNILDSVPPQSSSKSDSNPTKNIPEKLERATSFNKPVLITTANQKPQNSPSLLHMPCVSTTGNGPNGKTITGLLHRYTKTKVAGIVCACHGSSFSPAEFVKHAGGTNTTHPLRNIFVVPS